MILESSIPLEGQYRQEDMMQTEDFIYSHGGQTLSGIQLIHEGKIEKLIFLLHGYKGDAPSNFDFGKKIFNSIPQSSVFIPNGVNPIPFINDEHQRQWWDLDESSFEGKMCSFMPYYAHGEKRKLIDQMSKNIHKTALFLNNFILNQIRKYGLNLSNCLLMGISQGGMTAFEMVLFCKELHHDNQNNFLGALVIIGAGIIGADRLRSDHYSIPPVPVLLARAKYDEIFPKTVDYFSYSLLKEQNIPVVLKEVESVHFGLEHNACHEICRFIKDYF